MVLGGICVRGRYFRVGSGIAPLIAFFLRSEHGASHGFSDLGDCTCSQNPRQLNCVSFLSPRGRKTRRWVSDPQNSCLLPQETLFCLPFALSTQRSGLCRVVGAQSSGCETGTGCGSSYFCLDLVTWSQASGPDLPHWKIISGTCIPNLIWAITWWSQGSVHTRFPSHPKWFFLMN